MGQARVSKTFLVCMCMWAKECGYLMQCLHLDVLYLNTDQCISVFVCLCVYRGNTPFGIDSMPDLRKRRPIPLVSELVSTHHTISSPWHFYFDLHRNIFSCLKLNMVRLRDFILFFYLVNLTVFQCGHTPNSKHWSILTERRKKMGTSKVKSEYVVN